MADFDDLVGEHIFEIAPLLDARHPFDADANGVAFTLSGRTYLVFEDSSDGYRSYAAPLLSFQGSAYQLGGDSKLAYIREPVLCSIRTEGNYGNKDDVLEVRSKETGGLIFEVGTADIDDYYPGFVCAWHPENLSANSSSRISE